jgi:phosphoribosylaminoimidazole (AIR) synthetase
MITESATIWNGKLSIVRVRSTGLRSNQYAVMRKALESESNRLTISTRPAQVRMISGTVVLALALLFVMAALGAAFLLLQ